MTRPLYALLLWLTERDLKVTRATGRNPECIQNLSDRVHEYEVIIFQMDHSLFEGVEG